VADVIPFPRAGEPAPGEYPALTVLRDLVQLARDHRDAHDCPPTMPCPGRWVLDQIDDLDQVSRDALLANAVAELAALGYGLPTTADAYWPADPAGSP
jgi:hypothetical protein